jgi:hypothetical protein
LDKPIKDIRSTSGGLRKELDYLSDKGFKLSPDGWRRTKSESSVLKAAEETDTHSIHGTFLGIIVGSIVVIGVSQQILTD